MSPTRVTARFSDGGFPRVSGDEPVWLVMRDCTPWFSPRERG